METDKWEKFIAQHPEVWGASEYQERLAVLEYLQAEITNLKLEVNALRLYGNKDCTAMADEYLEEIGIGREKDSLN